jgi:hypothetical protein
MSHDPFGVRYGRGVHKAPFLGKDGEYVMVAITHDHRRIAEVSVFDDRQLDDMRRILQGELDRQDPVRKFRLSLSAFSRA